ncbi:hypothetical protein [Dokdonella soli]|uniref:Uncharacterized protein n=1 Tax=Dokdonella soli TaxID=529810 RepID=A0ABN1IYU2_9GAMM
MLNKRRTEVNVLGYRIERVQKFNERGEVSAHWYEVLAPESTYVLGTFAHRAEAEREIVSRELRALQRPAA